MFLPSSKSPIFKVGIYRTSSIGDVVLATSCINLLSKLNIPVEVTWVGRKPSLDLLKASFPSMKLIEANKNDKLSKNSEMIKSLSEVHMMIDLQTSIRSRRVCKILQSNYSIPYFICSKVQLYRARLLLEARGFSRNRQLPEKNLSPIELQHNLMSQTLVKGLKKHFPPEYIYDINDIKSHPVLITSHDTGATPWQKELKFDKWLAIAPGAAHPTKRAPVDVFVDIINRTKKKYQDRNNGECFGILVVGNQDDRAFGQEVLEKLSWSSRSLNLAGNLTLWETALALKETKVLLSNDSSLGHIAEAVETSTAILFGPTIEGFGFGPRLNASKAFSSLLGCRPCSKHGKSECRFKDKKCFSEINTATVADHLIQRLEINATTSTVKHQG